MQDILARLDGVKNSDAKRVLSKHIEKRIETVLNKINTIKQNLETVKDAQGYQNLLDELESLPISKERNKAIAEVKIKKQQFEQRPADLIISKESEYAATREASNMHLNKTEAEIEAFYNNLTDEQKSIIDRYQIKHDNVYDIHGILKLKLSEYDTPATIESRYQNALSRAKNGTISLEKYLDMDNNNMDLITEIQDDLMRAAKRERKLVIITGRAGGGKSTIARQLGLEGDYYFPDADDLKAFLPNYKEYGAGHVHGLSVGLNTIYVEKAFENGVNTVFQTTGWHGYVDEIIEKAVKQGYTDIQLIHTDVSADNSIKRSFSRAQGTGRTVDPSSIESSDYIDQVVDHCIRVNHEELDKILVYDNNGTSPKLVREIPLGY